jgi:hypothetical protein
MNEELLTERAMTRYRRDYPRLRGNPQPAAHRTEILGNVIELRNVNGVLARYQLRQNGKLYQLRDEVKHDS